MADRLTQEQMALVRKMKAEAKRRYADPHERMVKLKSAIATGIVEKNLTNTAGGDADSSNWRQERASGYSKAWAKTGGALNADASIGRYFDETDQLWDGKMDSAALAAKVQRPAAQYAHRYGLRDVQSKAQSLAKGSTTGAVPATAEPSTVSVTAPKVTPGTTKVDEDGALVSALLSRKQGGSLLKRYQANVDSGAYTTETDPTVTDGKVTTKTGGQSAAAAAKGQVSVDALKAEAQKINDKKLPYKWGGGHGDNSGLYDCSGVVSKLLGVNPRVSGEFAKFGEAGKGKRVTIYANSGHVLMEVDGHFYGTSRTNPGGGPGWIPRGSVSTEYLSKFTVRHPKGM